MTLTVTLVLLTLAGLPGPLDCPPEHAHECAYYATLEAEALAIAPAARAQRGECYTPSTARRPPAEAWLVNYGAPPVAVPMETGGPDPWQAAGIPHAAALAIGSRSRPAWEAYFRWSGRWISRPECQQRGPYACWAHAGGGEALSWRWRPALNVLAAHDPTWLSRHPACAPPVNEFETWWAMVGYDRSLLCRALEVAPDGKRRPACWDAAACRGASHCLQDPTLPAGRVRGILDPWLGCSVPHCGTAAEPPPPPAPPAGPPAAAPYRLTVDCIERRVVIPPRPPGAALGDGWTGEFRPGLPSTGRLEIEVIHGGDRTDTVACESDP